MGYKRLVTYTLLEEGGASLRGAGWRCIGEACGGNWNVTSRPVWKFRGADSWERPNSPCRGALPLPCPVNRPGVHGSTPGS